MALRNCTRSVDGTIPVQALIYDDERILGSQDEVGIYDGAVKAPDHQAGTAYITSHRLFYIDKVNQRKRSFCVDLSLVGQTDYYAGLFTSSAKITLHLSPPKPIGIDAGEAGPSSVDPFSQSWTCEVCDYRNPPGLSPTAAKKCGLCGVPREAVPAPLASMSELSTSLPSASPPNLLMSQPQDAAAAASDNGPDSNACPTCTFLNHPSLRECEMCSTPLPAKKTGAKSMKSAPATRAASPDSFSSQPGSMKLSFRKGGDKQFYTLLKGSLRNKVWEDSTSIPLSEEGTSGQRSGIEGIMRNVQSTNSQAVSGMEGAFQDLETLMLKAKDMVRLAAELNEKLTTATAQQQQHTASGGTLLPDFSEPEEATFIRSSLSQLGLHMEDTPVTKDMMRDEKEWIDILAKELGRVLLGKPRAKSETAWQSDLPSTTQGLMRGRGIMALDEVWGGWNRARGVGMSSLIPPSTMMSVIPRLPTFTDPQIYTRTFTSGLIVLHTPPYTAASFAARLYQTLLLSGPQSTMDIAAEEAVSVGLAKELIAAVEQDGAVCRDDAVCAIHQRGAGEETVQWWHNVIRDWTWDGQDYDKAI
ncbi:vacuolar protein sorting-associated protein 36 [Pterulicium gracile]|uniref:Vacuolar protein-sorting-associated protein 36 n=1 Tax=Pterulicium gracile TaxID=1884261 RepID=A0A5C3Q8T2_9AGAR|nr:vacuolar protein sorting-associated protein 36 [Pterula gracilis]